MTSSRDIAKAVAKRRRRDEDDPFDWDPGPMDLRMESDDSDQLRMLLRNAMPEPYIPGNRDDPRYYLNPNKTGGKVLGDNKFWRLLARDTWNDQRFGLPFTDDSFGFDPDSLIKKDLSDGGNFIPWMPPFVNYVGGTPSMGSPIPKATTAESPRTRARANAPQRGKAASKEKPIPKGNRKPPDNRKLV